MGVRVFSFLNQEIVNANVYTIHRKGLIISWEEYIVSLQLQLEQFANEDKSDNEV
jgi:hypothetical protein